MAWLQSFTAKLTLAGLAAKAVLFLLLFLWAQRSDTGAAVLRGAVGADLFSWIALSFVEWPFRRFQVKAGAVFELVLVVLYLSRGPLFDIRTDSMESTAVSMLFFMLVLFVKLGIWGAEHVLEVTGVKENASP